MIKEKYKGVYVIGPAEKYEGSRDVLEMLAELREAKKNGANDKL